MPTLTITVWNIQNYGFAAHRTRGNYGALHNFITAVVAQQQTDILFIQELQQSGVARLVNLRAALQAQIPAGNWQYDWIKAAIDGAAPPGPNTAITTAAQLGWTQSANREGYAVLFQNNAAKFTMTAAPPVGAAVGVANTQSGGVLPLPLPPGVPAHALTLVLQGRLPAVVPNSPWAHAAPAFNPAAPPAWADLDFNTNIGPNLIRNSSRRPAYCVIQLNVAGGGPAAATLMTLMTYHAPSNAWTDNAPPAGTQVASFARQLYQARNPAAGFAWINTNRALACGDFNVNGNPPALPINRQQSYASYTNAFAAAGANMTVNVPLGAANPANNTALSLTTFIGGPPIPNNVNPTVFRTAEFDNTFARGVPPANVQLPPQGNIYDLITAVQAGGTLINAPVQSYLPLVNGVLAGKVMSPAGPRVPATGRLVYPQITNWANFWIGLNAGQFPDNRSAAEFIKLFVSDHLPITYRFTY